MKKAKVERDFNLAEEASFEDETISPEKDIPSYLSEDWSDYVLKQFLPNEVDPNGHPLLHGLRRLANLLIGDIVVSGPITLNQSFNEGKPFASCVYEIQFGNNRIFRAVGDCNDDNTDHPFCKYASAIAETRGEARTLRKALGLNVVAKDELCNKLEIKSKGEKITTNQSKILEVKLKGLGLDLNKFSNYYIGRNLSECSKDDGAKLIAEMNNVQQNKVSEEVLKELR